MAMPYTRMKVGLDDLVYSVMDDTTDTPGGTITYGTVYSLYGARAVDIDPGASFAWEPGDDGGFAIGETVGEMKIALEVDDLLPADKARLFGHTYANGIISENVLDVSPYVAIGFRVLRMGTSGGNKVYDYAWIPKCIFEKPKANEATKGKTYTPRTVKIDGEFTRTLSSGDYIEVARSDDTTLAAGTISGWLATPRYVSTQDLGALTLTSVNGVNATSTKTFTLTFAKAGGGTTVIANGAVTNVVLTLASTGAVIPIVTFTPGTASTTPTLLITTSSTITAVAYNVSVNAGLTDSNGAPCVLKGVTCTAS